MTILNKAFTDAFCTEKADVITCACGHTHTAEPGKQVEYGEFAGTQIVKGCDCGPTSHLANTLWRVRHQTARFYRNFGKAQQEDQARLLRVLPAEEKPCS